MDGTLQTTTRRHTDRFRHDGTGSLGQGRLLVELYERLLRDLDDASEALDRGERERSHRSLLHAQEILEALDLALDEGAWDAATGLSAVYRFALDDLVRANVGRDAAAVRACARLMAPLADAFRTAWERTTDGGSPVGGGTVGGAPVDLAAAPVGAAGTTVDVAG